MRQTIIMPTDPERVSLAAAYHHFLALSPSPERARIDLLAAIREGRLDLTAEVVTELFSAPKYPPGAQPPPPEVTHNAPIPAAALQPCPEGEFDLERSRRIWRNSAKRSFLTFESITVSRDKVLALRPGPNNAAVSASAEPGGDRAKYEWDTIATELGRRIYDGEIDPIKASIRDVATQLSIWCDEKWEKHPAESHIRDKVKRWLKEYKK